MKYDPRNGCFKEATKLLRIVLRGNLSSCKVHIKVGMRDLLQSGRLRVSKSLFLHKIWIKPFGSFGKMPGKGHILTSNAALAFHYQ